jgi:hypothetical protein
MAAPGRKPIGPEEKRGRGTAQPSRDQGVTLIESLAPALALEPPPGLTAEASDVWADYVGHAVAHGARQCDADSFAEWCSMTAVLRKARELAAPAPASYVAQYRMLGENFGLVGPRSRVARIAPAGDAKPKNPFERNGVRR